MDYWITKLIHGLLILGCGYSQEVFNTMPPPVNTSFTCRGRDTGFYADTETNCRVYHTCDDHGNKFTYYCPEETAFRQEALVCDHAHLVDCAKGRRVTTLSEDTDLTDDPSNSRPAFDEGRRAEGRSYDVAGSGNSNPAYTRSFRITAEPRSPTPKSHLRKQPTFVLNSSVFFRDRVSNEKSSPASANNRVATESSKSLERIEENDDDKVSRKSSSTFFMTTFRPFRGDLESPRDIRYRYFDTKTKKVEEEKDDDDEGEFSGGSSPTFKTTFSPFGAGLKVKTEETMDSRFSALDGTNGKLGFAGGPSATFTTTFKPFGTNFKVKSEETMDSQFSALDGRNGKLGFAGGPSTTFTSTFKPFGTNFKVKSEETMDSQFSALDGRNGKLGFAGGPSATFTSTFKPFGTNFKVKSEEAMDSQFSALDGRNGKLGFAGGPSATFTTTFKPFGTDFKVAPIGKSSPSVTFKPFVTDFKLDSMEKISSSVTSSTTFRPFAGGLESRGELSGFGKVELGKGEDSSLRKGFKSDDEKINPVTRDWRSFGKGNDRSSSFLHDSDNFPYSETLRSMQAKVDESSQQNFPRTTASPATTAGTEFPVLPFAGSLAPLVPNELEDDPYYPRRPTTTEAYYKLSDREKGAKRPYRFSTSRPWPGSLDFEIPEVLPDFNTLDDLVDRRKLFFIPRVKAT